MTNSRQHELFNELVGWVCEHVSNDEELYHTLHNVLGSTDSEIEESDIDYLSRYFKGKPHKWAAVRHLAYHMHTHCQ